MIRVALIAGVFAAMAGAAAAQDILDAKDPDKLLNIARGFGSASLDKDDTGDPRIKGRIDGNAYTLNFFDCGDNHDTCRSVGFWAGWTDLDLTLEKINDWNREHRWPMAYQDDEGDSVVEMPVNLERGVTYDNMEQWFIWWQSGMQEFLDYANENTE